MQENIICGYPHFDRVPGVATVERPGLVGELHDAASKKIGWCKIVSKWKVNSWIGSHMFQIEATVDGKTYTGRGFGHGMFYKGKLKK